MEETEICSHRPGLMTNMADMPVFGKNFETMLLQVKFNDGVETQYVASGTHVLPLLFT